MMSCIYVFCGLRPLYHNCNLLPDFYALPFKFIPTSFFHRHYHPLKEAVASQTPLLLFSSTFTICESFPLPRNHKA